MAIKHVRFIVFLFVQKILNCFLLFNYTCYENIYQVPDNNNSGVASKTSTSKGFNVKVTGIPALA